VSPEDCDRREDVAAAVSADGRPISDSWEWWNALRCFMAPSTKLGVGQSHPPTNLCIYCDAFLELISSHSAGAYSGSSNPIALGSLARRTDPSCDHPHEVRVNASVKNLRWNADDCTWLLKSSFKQDLRQTDCSAHLTIRAASTTTNSWFSSRDSPAVAPCNNCSIFLTNARGYPVLSKAHQHFLGQLFKVGLISKFVGGGGDNRCRRE